MNDYTDETARAIRHELDSDWFRKEDESRISEVIRHHASPMPQWQSRPTCAGWWNFITEERPDFVQTIDMRQVDLDCAWVARLSKQWYGPIPPAPAKDQNDE